MKNDSGTENGLEIEKNYIYFKAKNREIRRKVVYRTN